MSFSSHCAEYKMLDLLGACILLNRERDLDSARNNALRMFIDVSYMPENLIRLLAEYIYTMLETGKYSYLNLRKGLVKLFSHGPIPDSAMKNAVSLTDWLNYAHQTSGIARTFTNYVTAGSPRPSNLMDYDVWYSNWFRHGDRRMKGFSRQHRFSFAGLTDSGNKELVKVYILHLLGDTELSYAHVYDQLLLIAMVLREMDRPALQISTIEANDYCTSKVLFRNAETGSSDKALRYVQGIAFAMYSFTHYVAIKKKLQVNNPWTYSRDAYRVRKQNIKRRAVSSYVLRQIFKVLPDLPEKYSLVFLVMFDTGLRICDACSLRRQDLIVHGKTASTGEFIITGAQLNYYNHKFNHEAVVFVSKSLAILLDAWRSTLDSNSEYMFSGFNTRSTPIHTSAVRRALQKFFAEKGIVEADGTPFHFEPHGLRHTCAVRMFEAGVPIATISAQLDHQSIAMTIRYLDSIEVETKKKNLKYLNQRGEEMILDDENSLSDEDKTQIRKARNRLRRMLLPNGICGRPELLKECPHYCTCVSGRCQYFYTNADYLPVHEAQYKEELKLIAASQSEPERLTHQKNATELKRVIDMITDHKGVQNIHEENSERRKEQGSDGYRTA
ncbi:site-specific integrase [Stecheria sp. CLA-KB-P133]|uniref:Site-specific integrase n=1 Tax=Grylomicrobium aquisgranensis TaxID=2926318 RepID=A0AB35U0X2_9FIRM|nr:site-specific integrase [Stecheria sp. CLA-KB-P133]